MHVTVVQVVAISIAFLAQFSRIFAATKPFWGRFPAAVQVWLPPLIPFAAALQAQLAGVATWPDLVVALLVSAALLLPGAPSNRSAAPLKSSSPFVPPPMTMFLLALVLAFGLPSCAALAPYLAQAAVVIADAINAIDAAEALLPSLNLGADQQAVAEKLIARLRAAASAAAKADAGMSDLTAEQLDASLADFRSAWADLQSVFAAARKVGAGPGAEALPVPLALRRVSK